MLGLISFSSFSLDENQFRNSEVDPQSTIDGEAFVTDGKTEPTMTEQGGFTTPIFYEEYDPGTKLQTTNNLQSENYSDNSQNQVGKALQAVSIFRVQNFLLLIVSTILIQH